MKVEMSFPLLGNPVYYKRKNPFPMGAKSLIQVLKLWDSNGENVEIKRLIEE